MNAAAHRARLEAQALRRRLRVAEGERDAAVALLRAHLIARLSRLPADVQARAPQELERLLAFLAGVETSALELDSR
jgi:hypothetical protein